MNKIHNDIFRDNLVRKVRSEVFFSTDKNPGA